MSRIVFTLSDLDQATAPRHMRQGSLTISQNTRSTKNGPRRKRRGFARTAVSSYKFPVAADATDSSAAATMQELSPGGQLFRDASDNIWARRSDGGQAFFRGEHRRCGVTARNAGFPEHKTIKPMSIAVGTQVWTFTLATSETSSSPTAEPLYGTIWLTIEDAAGTVVRGPIQYPAFTTGMANYAAVYHPGQSKVYIFTVYRDRVVNVFSISAAAGNIGDVIDTQTTYHDDADAKWNCVDAIYDTTLAQVVVAHSSWNEAGAVTVKVRHGKLNTSGNTESSGTNAESYNSGITGAFIAGGVSFLQGQPFTDGKVRYVYWVKQDVATSQDAIQLVQSIVNTTTMAEVQDDVLHTGGSTRYALEHAGVCVGFYKAATDETVVLAELMYPAIADEETTNPTGLGNSFNAQTIRVKFNNTTLASTVQTGTGAPAPGSWLASKPFQDTDGNWYVLTGVDSGTDGWQRAFHVRRADVGYTRLAPHAARIVAQIGWPTASFRGHRWRGQLPASPQFITNAWGWAPTVAAITGGCKVALGQTGETPQSHAVEIVTIDFAASFGQGVLVYDDHVLYPGGVPAVAGPRTPAHDLVPLLFPVQAPRLTAAGSSSALGACLVTSSFRFRDPSGRVTPSTSYPDPASLVFNSTGTRTLRVRNLQHIGHGLAEIVLWASEPGGTSLHIQTVIPNEPSSAETAIDVDPQNFRTDTEQLPASAEGALLPNPVPPCRLVANFAERIVLAATPSPGEFLYSQPFEKGRGPEFNIEGLSQTWTGGDIAAMSPVDLNSLALWRQNRVAVVQGPGPPAAGGAFGTILELKTEKGIGSSATRGVVTIQTPLGAVFQDFASGRLAVVAPGLRVDELPPGIEDSIAAARLVGGGLVESEGAVWFLTSSSGAGGLFVLDLRHPDETKASAWGNWHTLASTAITETVPVVGLVEVSGGPLWLQANGSFRSYKTTGQLFQDTNNAGSQVDVLQDMEMGLIAPAGHHGEVLVSDLQVLGTYLSASSVRLTTTNDAGTAENHDVTISDPFNYSWRPGNLLRVQEFKLRITEQAGSTGEGFVFDSLGVEFETAGKMKRLATTRIV
jgi:hypothetical protein